MLEELHVRDLALIEEVWLELDPGLNVLTGETGAGKTVLVEALQLLLGERADSSLVRTSADEAVVEGRFDVEGEERLVCRRLSVGGRSRCYLDGSIASVSELAQTLGPLVDLHGQHDHQTLLRTTSHADYLERFVGETAVRARTAYREAHAELSVARDAREEIEKALRDREDQCEYLTFQVDEIEAIAPDAGEDEELEIRLPRLRHGERLAQAASVAYHAIRDDGGGADMLARAQTALIAVSGIDRDLDALARELESTLAVVDDLGSRFRAYGEAVDYDPAALNEVEARLAALSTLKKKYGPTLEDVLAACEEAARRLASLKGGKERLSRAREAEETAEAALRETADRLVAILGSAAPDFAARLADAAEDLAMGSATFETVVEKMPVESWTADTPVRVEFLFSSSAGDDPKPLVKVASGGEVSRVMLALKSVLGAADATPVLVFDEIDAGIGGAVAVAVGRRLCALAKGHQVLVVTHLAQVAAFADRHLLVTRDETGGESLTTVRVVEEEERVRELARMLSGSDTEKGLAHARELLETVRAAD